MAVVLWVVTVVEAVDGLEVNDTCRKVVWRGVQAEEVAEVAEVAAVAVIVGRVVQQYNHKCVKRRPWVVEEEKVVAEVAVAAVIVGHVVQHHLYVLVDQYFNR